MEIMEQIRLMTLDMQRWKAEKYGRQLLTEQQFLDRYKTCDKCARQAVNSGKELVVEITIRRKRRSLDANAYLWHVLGQMAAVL